MNRNKRDKGKYFEQIAISYLLQKKYKIICNNFYTKYGEIDLIGTKDDYLIFFEVKGGKDKFKVFEKINKKKINRIKKVANIFISKNKIYQFSKFRIDALIIIAMEGNYRIFHYKNI